MKSRYLFILVPLVSSCASELKKKCESTNWFEHGKSIALAGKRLNSDNFVNNCLGEKVEVDEAQVDLGFKSGMGEYCSTSGATATGRKGDPFNAELCSPNLVNDLLMHHQKGVILYCNPTNAYQQGALGAQYKNVCPDNLEDAFLVQFKKGKRSYLTLEIEDKTQKLNRLEEDIEESIDKQNRLLNEYQQTNLINKIKATNNSNPEVVKQEEYQLQSLQSQIDSENYNRERLRDEAETLRIEIKELRRELNSIN